MSVYTAAIAFVSRPCIATFALRAANRRAMAAPIPRELPVIKATLSLRSDMATHRPSRETPRSIVVVVRVESLEQTGWFENGCARDIQLTRGQILSIVSTGHGEAEACRSRG